MSHPRVSPTAAPTARSETHRIWPMEIPKAGPELNQFELTHHCVAEAGEVVETVSSYQVCLTLSGPVSVAWKAGARCDRHLLLPGDLCTVSNGDFRWLSWDAPIEFLRLNIAAGVMEELSEERGNGEAVELIAHRGLRDPTIVQFVQMLRTDATAIKPCRSGPVFGDQLGRALAVLLFERYCVFKPKERPEPTRLPGAVLKRVLNYIEDRIAAPIAIKDLANHVQISHFYFSRLFRNTVGKSPGQYILDRRMDRARCLLEEADADLTAVARLTGFSSESAFASAFRFRNGITPSRYRRMSR